MKKIDNRPRFGWSGNLDNDPQVITEVRWTSDENPRYVVVIPLPHTSAEARKKARGVVRKFMKTLYPK